MSNLVQPHRRQPTRLHGPWDSPGKNTGVGCHFLLQEIFPTQELNQGLLHCRQILYQLSYEGSLYCWAIKRNEVLKYTATDKPWKHYTQWKKPVTNDNIFRGSVYMKCPKRQLCGNREWISGCLGLWEGNGTPLSLFSFMHWRRKWQPTPVFLPGESQGPWSLVGCRLWGCTESDTTEAT